MLSLIALAWLEYCNSDRDTHYANIRRANGHEEPYKVKYWALGNEVWGPWSVEKLCFQLYDNRSYLEKVTNLDGRGRGKLNKVRKKTVQQRHINGQKVCISVNENVCGKFSDRGSRLRLLTIPYLLLALKLLAVDYSYSLRQRWSQRLG